ncbi:tyrosine-type recombinase/integrase [Aliicoccus persicus]|uniref:tyrosine-type recombinase/integrase n=1 Tax=Aliicoccus persicus TaxID=930138 RepID=UPI002482076C|nr:tyrosine-type recombinase/integrase [Aliicoccus persicus]
MSQAEKERTFKSYYMEWIEAKKKGKITDQQYYWYTYSIKLFCEYFSEDKKISDLTDIEYQSFLNWYGKGRTKSSLEKVHVCLSQVIKRAHNQGILVRNPAHDIDLNFSKEEMKEEEKYLTIKQYLDLIEFFRSKNERSYLLLFILAITGARFSEVNKLTLNDLSIDTIHLRGTKTKTSDRVIEISHQDMEHIRSVIRMMPQKINGEIFGISHNACTKSFKFAMKHLDIKEYRTPYSLRHTHCSYLISEGIPVEYISKRLGHANIKITLEVYSHLLEEHKDEQANKVRALFSK